jgi:hypothetical protein
MRPAAALVMAFGLGTGAWLLSAELDWRPPPQPPAGGERQADQPAVRRDPELDREADRRAPLAASAPVRVFVPAIGVDAPLTGLGLLPDGRLTPPPQDTPGVAGWYRDGIAPGTAGTAVLAGHVDAEGGGRAVFHQLGRLVPGDTVEVERRDGLRIVFTLYAVEVFDGADFPDAAVYGATGFPEVRLITCGGEFSRERNEYQSNIVAFGVLSGAR